jgi:replicative DNA helicase
MASEEVVSRYISHETALSYRALFHTPWVLSNFQKERISSTYDESKSLLVSYQELSTNITQITELSNWFCEACLRKEKILGVEVVPVMVIDYIGMAKFEGGADLRTYKLGELMNSLKTLSKVNDQHTIALAQIGRGADSKDMPGRTDLADSQGIVLMPCLLLRIMLFSLFSPLINHPM